jgi:hypothetical protein
MSIAGAGLLSNAGLGINSSLVSNLGSFDSLGITSQFSDIVTSATGVLDGGVLDSLRTLGADVFPALTNAIPSSFTSVLGSVANGGFTGLIDSTASSIMGGGDLSKFGQVFQAATGYTGLANSFIDSALNATNLSTTFSGLTGGMDNLITGGLNQVSGAFSALGGDLTKLGSAIDLGNLQNLGDPSALLKQVASVGGSLTPGIDSVLRQAGVNPSLVNNITDVNFPGVSDSVNKALYTAMTNVTGSDLQQVKSILNVTTPGINNMAELLDPKKILPTSYSTLTMPTPSGLKGIYNAAGSVNTNLESVLQDPNAPAYTGDDPIVRARLGLDPINNNRSVVI